MTQLDTRVPEPDCDLAEMQWPEQHSMLESPVVHEIKLAKDELRGATGKSWSSRRRE